MKIQWQVTQLPRSEAGGMIFHTIGVPIKAPLISALTGCI